MRFALAGALAGLLGGGAVAQTGSACRGCHPAEVEGWRASGMSRALEPLRPGELVGLAPVAAGTAGYSYRFEQGERGAALVESWRDPLSPSRPPVEQRHPVAFAIGAGILDRSYALRYGDVLRFAPLEFVRDRVKGTRHAALAPGHAIDARSRFTIPIAEECLRCHTSALPPREYPYDLAPPPGWEPRGIDCEACHADAARHAGWRELELSGRSPEGGDPLGAVPTPVQSGLASCARCHLQGDAIVSLGAPWRGVPGPEDDVFALRAVFVAATPTSEIGFVSQVERLAQSRCFLESWSRPGRQLVCTTCHDPHASSFEPQERERVRSACVRCHPTDQAAHPAGSGPDPAVSCSLPRADRGQRACVECHMRRTGVHDVGEVEIHDHRIERRPPAASHPTPLRVKTARDGKLAHFVLPGGAALTAKDHPGVWTLAHYASRYAEIALPLARFDPGPIARQLPTFFHARGSLLEQARDLDQAERAYREALVLDPQQAESAVNLGSLLARTGREAEALELLTRTLEAHPRAEGALRNRALIHLARKDDAAALADLQAAHAIAPQAAIAHLLSQLSARRGEAELAAGWAAEAARLEPDRGRR